jgi:hypothetical protein
MSDGGARWSPTGRQTRARGRKGRVLGEPEAHQEHAGGDGEARGGRNRRRRRSPELGKTRTAASISGTGARFLRLGRSGRRVGSPGMLGRARGGSEWRRWTVTVGARVWSPWGFCGRERDRKDEDEGRDNEGAVVLIPSPDDGERRLESLPGRTTSAGTRRCVRG